MGMGEPAHNLDNVMEAIELLGTAGGIGHKEPRVLDGRGSPRVRAPACGPGQAGSRAVAALDEGRACDASCCPCAAHDADELVEEGERYARATGYPIQYQWTLLEGVNDGADELDGIVRLLKGQVRDHEHDPVQHERRTGFRRPSRSAPPASRAPCTSAAWLTKLRQSAGQDVEGGCGQLRARESVVRMPQRRADAGIAR